MFKRIGLFLITNLAILFVLSITLRLLGVDSILDQSGGLNLNALLVFAAVFGMGGSFISLAMSKWIAQRAVGAQVIQTPSNAIEQWLVDTVRRQAQQAGIGMPDVAVYDAPEMVRLCSPVYLKTGSSVLERHGMIITEELAVQMARQVAISMEMLQRYLPEAVQTSERAEDLAIPV